ncbi:Mariner Mos1 transposase [Eumeta japonica]|uniref:Mariner Mos1 transposase n=1 Tax=Eumeta variegata TaxID=151549 RepID=A0A4C1X2K8_EUMVA|nr:Mariner Mos1 transposase [Eumeta japonica]
MLCVWWDRKGIIYYELLPTGKTINSYLYCQQLMRLKQEVERKRPEVINRKDVVFHHDNARPHTSLATQQILRECGCTSARAVVASLWTASGVLLALCTGAALRKLVHSDTHSSSSMEQNRDRELELSTLATLVLLYEDCCSAFADAQGQAHIRDALLCLSIVCTCVLCGAGAWWCMCWRAGVEPALASVALPHLVSTGWEMLSCCGGSGAGVGAQVRLVRAAAAPAHALLLTALAVRTRHISYSPCSRCTVFG